MQLVKPTKKYEKSWHEALAEFRSEGRKGFWNWEKEPHDLDKYIKLTRDNEKGENLSKDWVPATTYWLIDNGQFIGHTNIRHKLNDYLAKIGGNIGYYIRPSARNKGYGTKILELALIKARQLGLQKVLITCDESNIASKKIIEKKQRSVSGQSYCRRRTEAEILDRIMTAKVQHRTTGYRRFRSSFQSSLHPYCLAVDRFAIYYTARQHRLYPAVI